MSSGRIVKIPGEYISNVFGKFDENIQALERKCSVTIVNREGFGDSDRNRGRYGAGRRSTS